jgi:hypothetical protein
MFAVLKRSANELFTAAAVLVGLVAVVFFLFLFPVRPQQPVKLWFLAMTNAAPMQPSASFCVTNESDEPVILLNQALVCGSATYYSMEEMSPPVHDLLPHQAKQFAVPLHIFATNWFVRVDWFFQNPNALESFREQVKMNLQGNWNMLKMHKWPRFVPRSEFVLHTTASPVVKISTESWKIGTPFPFVVPPK